MDNETSNHILVVSFIEFPQMYCCVDCFLMNEEFPEIDSFTLINCVDE